MRAISLVIQRFPLFKLALAVVALAAFLAAIWLSSLPARHLLQPAHFLLLVAAGLFCVCLFFAAFSLAVSLPRSVRPRLAAFSSSERDLLNAVPCAIFCIDALGNILSWNAAAERLFGWREPEVLGRSAPLIPRDLAAKYVSIFNAAFPSGEGACFETETQDLRGVRIPARVSVSPFVDKASGHVCLCCAIEDTRECNRLAREVTEISKVLSTVTQSLSLFLENGDWGAASRLLLSLAMLETGSRIGLLGVVLEGNNLRFLAFEGDTPPAHAGGSRFQQKLHDHMLQGFFEVQSHTELFQHAIAEGKTVVCNSPRKEPLFTATPPGHPLIESYMGIPICKGSETVALIIVANRAEGYDGHEFRSLDAISRVTGVLFDNYRQDLHRRELETQRRQLEGEFRQSQKMEVLGRLAGGIAHDFNNMLMVLVSCAELLERSIAGNAPALQYLGQMRRTTEKAAGITRQLLAFSRKQMLDIKPMDLHEVLTDSEFMLPRLLGSDVELTFNYAARNSWIQADASQMGQIIANLAINARDAMPLGGQLSISTCNSTVMPPGAQSNDPADSCTEWVVLSVSDTGSGMDENTRSHLFEPFFTTKPVGRGTGLGLSTVYGIVRQCSGHIFVHSQPGAGTCMELYFPRCDTSSLVPQDVAPPGAAEAERALTILLADDEAALRAAVAEFLRMEGHRVLEANSAHDGLEIARLTKEPIDLLLTDVVMPGLRGPDLAREVTALHPETHVMFMSGYAEGLPETEIPSGAVFLQKPFRFSALREQITLVSRTA